MQVGMIGLGRMGANMVRRLLSGGHDCVIYSRSPQSVTQFADESAEASFSLDDFAAKLRRPRVAWIMIPAAAVEQILADLTQCFEPKDIIIDGGNSYYVDTIRRGKMLRDKGLHYIDCGTSGGVWGLERGFCLMLGGDSDVIRYLDPIFATLAPPIDSVPRTPGREAVTDSTAEHGYLHCGPNGAGHFVKMVHNGIEYGIMSAYAEGLNVLRHANAGEKQRGIDSETAPIRDPDFYKYDFNLAEIVELWRRGSVIGSWLLDLTARALLGDPDLKQFAGRVSDSGEGRWTIQAAIDEGVPVHVLSAALFERFNSRGAADFANKLLSALRYQFGGHLEKDP